MTDSGGRLRDRALQEGRDFASWLIPAGRRAFERIRAFGHTLRDRSVPRSRRAWMVAKGAALLSLILFAYGLAYTILLIPFTPGISELSKAKAERPSVLLAVGGERLATFKPVNREWVELDEISPHVIDALIATEDHRFYRHHGVDFVRLFGALYHTARGNTQGGSTLTQQLARNLYPDEIGRDRSITRKIREAITAFKIEYAYEKDEILLTYLNTVPFYFNAYGIEMASRTYFRKSAEDLTLLQSATLVGMLKGTVYYNPVRRPERALDRRNVVLSQMVRRGKLDSMAYRQLVDEPLGIRFARQPAGEVEAPHFSEHVRRWLIEWADRNGYNIYRDSLVVHTTLDLRLQNMAERAVTRQTRMLQAVANVEWGRASDSRLSTSPRRYLNYRGVQPFRYFWESRPGLLTDMIRTSPEFEEAVEAGLPDSLVMDSLRSDSRFVDSLKSVRTRLEAGFVAIDPEVGEVRAWVGSRDYDVERFDHVAMARRQPGSVFKPFVYARALQEGFAPSDTLSDREVEIKLRNGQIWKPKNAGGRFSNRPVSLKDGLIYSKNTITAQLIDQVGPADVADLASRMGVRSPLTEVPSLALGTSEVTLLEMVGGYATFAAEGVYHEPIFVTSIEDRYGNVLASFESEPRRVLKRNTALALVDMMRGVVNRGTGTRIRRTFGIRSDVAGKTGTTQDNVDGWFVLMHPRLVAGAWVGFNDPRVSFRSSYWGQGGNNALLLVGDFFDQALDSRRTGLRGAEFPPAPDVESRRKNIFTRFGEWIGRTLDRIGDLIFGPEEVEPPAPQNRRTVDVPVPQPSPDSVLEGTLTSDSLNRAERDSTRLREYLERIRQERDSL